MLERVPSSASKQIAHLAIGGERVLSQRFQEVICINGTVNGSTMTTLATKKATGKATLIIETTQNIPYQL